MSGQPTEADIAATHWLLFNNEREITGCHCGFKADMDSDCGWGDSVVEHLLTVCRCRSWQPSGQP